jgi:hypothetical protein
VVRIAGLTVLVMAGCGAHVDNPGTDPPDGGDPRDRDAAPLAPDAMTTVVDNECGVAETQGDIGELAALGERRDQGQPGRFIYALYAPTPATAADDEPDVIYIELWDDYGVFLGDRARPGTYAITGDELAYDTCGVCVFTLADVDPQDGANRILLATGGSVTVIEVSPVPGTPLEIELDDVRFREVDPQDFTPVGGSDCDSPLAHGRLDGTTEPN